MRVASDGVNRIYETGHVSYKLDIRSCTGLALTLLMLIAAIAPACLLMMPSTAVASEVAVAAACDLPGGTLGVDCPRTFQRNILTATNDNANVAVLPGAIVIAPALVSPVAHVATLVTDGLPTAHLTPLRL